MLMSDPTTEKFRLNYSGGGPRHPYFYKALQVILVHSQEAEVWLWFIWLDPSFTLWCFLQLSVGSMLPSMQACYPIQLTPGSEHCAIALTCPAEQLQLGVTFSLFDAPRASLLFYFASLIVSLIWLLKDKVCAISICILPGPSIVPEMDTQSAWMCRINETD